jgi:hypothetical protein
VLVRVVAPHFVAGAVFDRGVCIRAAPIIKYCIGKTDDWCRHYFKSKGWKASLAYGHTVDSDTGRQ